MGLRTFSFDGISSDTFNLFINEAGPHGAPERAVEMLEIPGRNGFYALDQGRFNNTEVTYHVVVDGSDDADFSEEIADVREWLCSGTGYKRLEDDYNPNEYRMAVFRNGFDTDESFWNGAEFDITFDCKPQRWLKSGETATAVANNGTLTNPTLFDAEPLLEVKGYGGIEFNGFGIDIQNTVIGDVVITSGDLFATPKTFTLDSGVFNSADTINIGGKFICGIEFSPGYNREVNVYAPTDTNSSFTTKNLAYSWQGATVGSPKATAQFETEFATSVVYGTNKTITNTAVVKERFVSIDPSPVSCTLTYTMTQTITYKASTETITFTASISAASTNVSYVASAGNPQGQSINIIGHSTMSALGNPTYIDCEIGEAYMYKGGNIVSSNSAVALGSDLPTLAPGTNEITFDNTVTELKIHPRWWRV